MNDLTGPVGFQHIESAPRNTFVRLRFRRGDTETIGQWLTFNEMKSGGSWVDRDGFYISPGPLFWAPMVTSQDRGTP